LERLRRRKVPTQPSVKLREKAAHPDRGASPHTTQGGSKVTVTENAVVQTVFMEIFGINTVRISSTSPTSWGAVRLRIALVLDVTGSMPNTAN
jgi:hypothetical protein